ncbi:armadillo-type protein, partial [Mycena galopus ATCC 62051]
IKPFLPTILPLLLKVFAVESELTEKSMGTQMKILEAFQMFGANIEEHLHLVIPIIVRTGESAYGSVALRRKAILTINQPSRVVNFSDHVSRIVHPLMRILERGCLIRHPITHPGYDRAITTLLNSERLTHETNPFIINDNKVAEFAPMEAAKLTVNQIHLKQAWDTAQINARQNWINWFHRLGVEFIKESPSHALRACMSLVETQSPLARELFNPAFLSCWSELYEQYQDHLVRSIEIALTSPITPSEVIRTSSPDTTDAFIAVANTWSRTKSSAHAIARHMVSRGSGGTDAR